MNDGVRILTDNDIKDHGTTQLNSLGARGVTADGRRFVYVKSDGSGGLAVGKLGVAAAVTSNHVNQSLASTSNVAVGSTTVDVTLGATAAAADLYKDGYLVVRDGAGAGQCLRINGHTSVSSAGGTCHVSLYDPVQILLSTSTSKVDLISPFNGVVASTTLSRPIGVAPITLAAAEYGWVQTHGTASVLADGIITKGVNAIQSTSVAGAVAIANVGNVNTLQAVGYAPEATVDTKYTQLVLGIEG